MPACPGCPLSVGRHNMKFLKVIVIVLAIMVAAGIGIYMCTDSKEAEKVEEAVLI